MSKAREYESYKQLPRFSKPHLAVIHPKGRDKIMKPASSTKDLEVLSMPLSLKMRPVVDREIPDHLMKAPNLKEISPEKRKRMELLKKKE